MLSQFVFVLKIKIKCGTSTQRLLGPHRFASASIIYAHSSSPALAFLHYATS